MVRLVNLNHLLTETIQIVQVVIPQSASLRMAVDTRAPEVELDPAQVQEIVLQLVGNAVDAIAGRPGLIDINTGIWSSNLNANLLSDRYLPSHVYLEVADNGCGMDEATLRHALEPSFTTKPGAAGVGLTLVQSIVRCHAGFLNLDSTPGRGTSVKSFFPVRPANALASRRDLRMAS